MIETPRATSLRPSPKARGAFVEEEEGREALVAWLGQAAEAAPEERDALRAEWRVEPPKARYGQ